MESKPVYMARINDSRVRRLPPLTPIREASHPGATETESVSRPKTPIKAQPPPKPKLADVPEEYRYLVMRDVPEKSKDDVVWHPYEVNQVVDHYLSVATLGASNPVAPDPNTLCECCSSINDENKRRTFEAHTHPHIRPSTEHPPLPNALKYQPTRFDEPKPLDYSADYGIYRTESPELLSDSNHLGISEQELAALDTRTIFVTHPAKKNLYSNWGVRNEVENFGYDRTLAENVVEASSKYIDAMERLKRIGSPR